MKKFNFRRTTHITCPAYGIMVSTIGDFMPDGKPFPIGADRYYETRAFLIDPEGNVDLKTHVMFDADDAIVSPNKDHLAYNMHEEIVAELMEKMATMKPMLGTIINEN